ncbi:hypothetical protein CANINC_000709 [Pichia inconspicua]|uniref:Uncharacterized protein n=1 Tax=Pichia inconspicua TaxID=52247 RepID=A0A4T0X641_9ASCO|nr:hypothetical protein CANINC_000709 [[Candida] inconspicua]
MLQHFWRRPKTASAVGTITLCFACGMRSVSMRKDSSSPVQLDLAYLTRIYETKGSISFIQEVVLALTRPSVAKWLDKNCTAYNDTVAPLELVISKLNEIAHTKQQAIHYCDIEGSSKRESIIQFLFHLSLSLNLTKFASIIMTNSINYMITNKSATTDSNLMNTLITKDNINILIQILSVDQTQKRDVYELNTIFNILTSYNRLVRKRGGINHQVFELSDPQIKKIIDKAYNCVAIDKGDFPPHSTVENVIRELGLIVSERVSDSISYYKSNAFDNKDKEEGIDEIKIPQMNLQELLDRQLLSKYLHFCYFIIRERCSQNDPATVCRIWEIIKPFHTKLFNSIINSEVNDLSNNFYYYQTLAKMIRVFSKNERYRLLVNQIIYNLPLDSVKVCPELMAAILYHCARTGNESLGRLVGSRYDDSNNIRSQQGKMDQVFGQGGNLSILNTGEKFTPEQVHAFLAYNLRLGKIQRANEIMNYLKYKLIGFTDIDFNELVRSVLYNDKDEHDKVKSDIAWELIENNIKRGGTKLNKYAIITYLDYMLNEECIDFERIESIFSLVKKCAGEKDVKYWNHFNMSYFKYIIRKYPLQMAKQVYDNSKAHTMYIEGKDVFYFEKLTDLGYTLNPFTQKYHDVRITMDPQLRALVLRDIYQKSDSYVKRARQLDSADLEEAEAQHDEISQWVRTELQDLLVPAKDTSGKRRGAARDSVAEDLLRAVNARAREAMNVATNTNPDDSDTNTGTSTNELRYRLHRGERVPIQGTTVADDYRQQYRSRNRRQQSKQPKQQARQQQQHRV